MPDSSPIWDLTDLYSNIEDMAITADIEASRAAATSLAADWRGRLGEADGPQLASLIAEYERILETLGKAASHAQLQFAANTTDAGIARHHQSIREAGAEIGAELLFVELELATLPQARIDALCETAAVAAWMPWLRRVRAMAPYQLAPDMERMLAERAPTGRGAWVRLFDETAAGMRFPFKGADVTEAEILNSLASADGDERREAGSSLSTTLKSNQRLLSLVLNTIAKDKEIEDRWRGFKRPVASRNLDNDVDDEVVDALVSAVDSRNADLAHRYYRLKAGWMGGDAIDWWDRNAPLPDDDDSSFTWEEAERLVMDSFAGFDPQMADLAAPFFERNWIDAAPRAGKSSGAFSHPVTPSAHPYILMNFSGKSRDVMTLAHEMGHGI
ncbi:MAG: M3 family metallopeptidase, partial [Rhodobiaceae bacterium]